MRLLKNYKGIIADFVFVTGLLSLTFAVGLHAKVGDSVDAMHEARAENDEMPPIPPGKMNDRQMPPFPGGKFDEPRMPQGSPPGRFDGRMPPPQQGRPDDSMPPPPGKNDDPQGPPPGFGAPSMPKGMMDDPPVIRRMNGNPPSMQRGKNDRLPSRPNNTRNRSKSGNQNESDILRVVPQTCKPARGHFIWNFEEEELINILRQVSDLLCKTIVVNDAIAKNMKITIIGKSPLTPKDAWDVLVASLAAKGLALIEQGKTWTVIKRNESKSYATPMYDEGKKAHDNEEIGTLFYKAQHASQEALKNVARVLISKDGMVDAIGDQFIIVIDSNSNIRRLGTIFSQIDVEDAINKIHVIPVEHADAKTVEKQLRELFDISAQGGNRGRRRRGAPGETRSALDIEKIIADERSNSLIVIADKDSVEKLKEVVTLIDQADTDQKNKGKIHVKKLKYADAKKIAETLSNVVTQGKTPRFPRRRPEEGTHELFEGEVKITAHENTNTLVTVASANDYRSLLMTINELDIRKEQVYVEAVILDIQVSDSNDFGLNIFSGLDVPGLGGSSLGLIANPGGRSMVDGVQKSLTQFGTSGTNIAALGSYGMGALAVMGNFMSGGFAGLVGPKIPGTEIPSFGAVLQALSTNRNIDVLSTPYMLTTDNTEAEMSVGEKVPVLKGTSTIGSGGLGAALGVPLQNVAYEDVKLTFKITPHVGADDNVRLDINQEVNELGPEENILGAKQYRIRTKNAKTTLVLKDQQTGVIGGLINHKSTSTDNKVPFLGDIPILGWLFKNRHSDNERKNLLLIITPYVIRTDEDYKKIVERKMKEREEFARLYYGGKIRDYNKYIDYDKKAGPLSSLLLSVDREMTKAENGGSSGGEEVIIIPKEGAPGTGVQKEPGVNLGPKSEGGRGARLQNLAPTLDNEPLFTPTERSGGNTRRGYGVDLGPRSDVDDETARFQDETPVIEDELLFDEFGSANNSENNMGPDFEMNVQDGG